MTHDDWGYACRCGATPWNGGAYLRCLLCGWLPGFWRNRSKEQA